MDAVGEEVTHGGQVKGRACQHGHLGNAARREYKALHKKKVKTAAAVRQLYRMGGQNLRGVRPPAVVELLKAFPDLGAPHGPCGADWIEVLSKTVRSCGASMKAVLRKYDREQQYKWERRMDDQLRYNTKQVHRNVFGGGGP